MADLIAPLPQVEIPSGFTVKLEAVHPTTGAAVAGVTVSAGVIFGETVAASLGGDSLTLPLGEVGWLPVPTADELTIDTLAG